MRTNQSIDEVVGTFNALATALRPHNDTSSLLTHLFLIFPESPVDFDGEVTDLEPHLTTILEHTPALESIIIWATDCTIISNVAEMLQRFHERCPRIKVIELSVDRVERKNPVWRLFKNPDFLPSLELLVIRSEFADQTMISSREHMELFRRNVRPGLKVDLRQYFP